MELVTALLVAVDGMPFAEPSALVNGLIPGEVSRPGSPPLLDIILELAEYLCLILELRLSVSHQHIEFVNH